MQAQLHATNGEQHLEQASSVVRLTSARERVNAGNTVAQGSTSRNVLFFAQRV